MILKNFMTLFLLILFIGQIRDTTSIQREVLVATYNGSSPGLIYLGELKQGDKLGIRLLVPEISYKFYIKKGAYNNLLFQSDFNPFISLDNLVRTSEFTIQQNNWYRIQRYNIVNSQSTEAFIDRFLLEITLNGQIWTDPNPNNLYSSSYQYGTSLSRSFYIKNYCQIIIDPSKFSSSPYLSNFTNLKTGANESFTTKFMINVTAGEYRFDTKYLPLNSVSNYTIPIYTDLYMKCVYEQFYCCKNTPSCQKCSIQNGERCSTDGNAICLKCGNKKVDSGEDCDGVDGCTSDCKAAAGYQCSNNVCNFLNCGNQIVDQGEQCDNGKQLTCIGCKIVPPYKCKNKPNLPSVCFHCGNSIFQQGQECDNGNKTGCINCTLDRGYTCKSKRKQITNCTNVCGDGLWTPEEECDNGNKTGCINCVISAGYSCKNTLLAISKCNNYKCGNYIVEPGEQCDNNNVNGCKNCQIQPGWNCRRDPRYCYLIAQVCGNGQRQIEEDCDDGNKLGGDGCSSLCKTETGYNCSQGLGEKSVCSKM